MRIAILYSDDLFSNAIFAPLLADETLRGQIAVVLKDISQRHRRLYKMLHPRNKYSFKFLAANLFIDWVESIHRHLDTGKNFLALAKKAGIPVVNSVDFNSKDTLDYLKAVKPDLVINRAGQILKGEILGIPSKGSYNIHCSLLPKYKGWVSSFWVLQKREKETGVTLHRMTERVDTGEIIKQRSIPIEKEDTYYAVQKKCARAAGTLLRDFVKNKEFAPTAYIPEGRGSYFGFPKRIDLLKFRKTGRFLITAREMAAHIVNGLQ